METEHQISYSSGLADCWLRIGGHSQKNFAEEKVLSAIKDRIQVPLNVKVPLSEKLMEMAVKLKPDRITLMPEIGIEKRSEESFDFKKNRLELLKRVRWCHDQDIEVSFFVEPETDAVTCSKECGVDFIEINTRRYCNAGNQNDRNTEISRIYRAAEHAVDVGIKIGAGHGLDYQNIMPVLKTRALEEVYIGRSIAIRADAVGLSKAVKEMLEIME